MVRPCYLFVMFLVPAALALFDEATPSMSPIFPNSLHYPGGVRKVLGFDTYLDEGNGYFISNQNNWVSSTLHVGAPGFGNAISSSFNASRVLVGFQGGCSDSCTDFRAYLFESDVSGSYSQVQQFQLPEYLNVNGDVIDNGAASVAISPDGTIVLVSHPGANAQGVVHVYLDSPGGWDSLTLEAPVGAHPNASQFGTSVQFSERSSFIVTANVNPTATLSPGHRVFLYQYRNTAGLTSLLTANNGGGTAELAGADAEGLYHSETFTWALELNPFPDAIPSCPTSAPPRYCQDVFETYMQMAPRAVISADGRTVLAGLPIYRDEHSLFVGRAYALRLYETTTDGGWLVPETRLIAGGGQTIELRPDKWVCQSWAAQYVRVNTTEYWQNGSASPCNGTYVPDGSSPENITQATNLQFGGAGLALDESGSRAIIGTPQDNSLKWTVSGAQQNDGQATHGSAWSCGLGWAGGASVCNRLTPSLATLGGRAGGVVAISRDGANAIVGGGGFYDTYDIMSDELPSPGVRKIRTDVNSDLHEQGRFDGLVLSPDNRVVVEAGQKDGTLEWSGAPVCPVTLGVAKADAAGTIRCSCFSGHAGGLCQQNELSLSRKRALTCSPGTWRNLTALETNFIPDFPAFQFENNHLRMEVINDYVTNRRWTEVRITDADNFNFVTNPVCAYPGPAWWKYTADLEDIPNYNSSQPCKDRWSGIMPWVDAIDCFKENLNATAGHREFLSFAVVHHRDLVDNFRGIDIFRDTEHVIPLKIKFQTEIVVSTTITVSAPTNLLAALIGQTYDPSTGKASLTVVVELNNPFKCINGAMSLHPPDLPAVVTPDGIDISGCPDEDGEYCRVVYTIEITPGPAVCTLNGQYNLTGSVVCHESVIEADECPITNETDTTAIVTLDVVSNDFCAVAGIDIGANGELDSYQANTFLEGDQRHSFFVEVDTFYQAKVWMSETLLVTALSLEEVWIKYTNPDTSAEEVHFLYQAGEVTLLGVDMAFDVIPYAQQPSRYFYSRFQFRPRSRFDLFLSGNSQGFPGITNGLPIKDDGNMVVSVYARLRINIEGTISSRRTSTMIGKWEDENYEELSKVTREDKGSEIASSNILTPIAQIGVYYEGRSVDDLGFNPPSINTGGQKGAAATVRPFWQ